MDANEAATMAALDEAHGVTTDEPEKMAESGSDTPESIREFRERLGLSRRDVEIGTSLSSSVVWRSEQVGRNVTDEERTKIWDFLVGFEAEHPEGKVGTSKNLSPTKTQRAIRAAKSGSDDALARETKAREELQSKVWELRHVIDEAHTQLVAMRTEAKAKKRSTAGMNELIDLLGAHITD